MKSVFKSLTISRLGKWLISSLVLVALITLVTNWLMVREVLTLNTSWSDKEHNIVRKQAYLSVLRGSIGYGGMIHNFKNYVLRNERHYLLSAYRSMLEAKIIMIGYRQLGVSQDEYNALSDLETVIEKYRVAMARTESLFRVNYSRFRIDEEVAVDDTPALRALLSLTNAVANLRQAKTNIISKQINSLIITVTVAAGGIGLLLLFMIFGLTWFLRFRLINPLGRLIKAFNQVDLNAPGSVRLPSTGANGDELDMMANAGNRFLDTVEAHLAERQQARDQLEEAKNEAEFANQAKSNFLSTMSHEIRTPLNGVLGIAQLLIDTDLNQDQRQKVNTILSSGQTLLAILNDVLDMSKIEAGGIELEHNLFSLGGLISTVTTPFQSLADDKGLQLNVKDGGLGKLVIKGDPVRLRQIIWNLLSNAIKFTEHGSITLTIEEQNDASRPPAGDKIRTLHFSVRDTGAGIQPDRVGTIFEAFTQEDNTISRKHGGTGLGLTIVKQLTELMGGAIDVESQIGEGTVFNVSLPFGEATKEESDAISLRTAEAMSAANANDTNRQVEPLNVLVAEDNEVNAVIAKAFLKKFGHNVRHVENGVLAVEAARDGWADLILMDVHMSEMNGMDATKAIRLTEIGKNLPIIGLTAEAFAERHVVFKEAGMNGVLTKPFTERQLADILSVYRPRDSRGTPRPEKPHGSSAGDRRKADAAAATGQAVAVDGTEITSGDSRPAAGDEDSLNAFRDQLDADTVLALLKEAQSSLERLVGALRTGVRDMDPNQIREAAHTIKGVGGSMFAMHISELAGEIESCSTDMEAVRGFMPAFEVAARDALDWWHQQETGPG